MDKRILKSLVFGCLLLLMLLGGAYTLLDGSAQAEMETVPSVNHPPAVASTKVPMPTCVAGYSYTQLNQVTFYFGGTDTGNHTDDGVSAVTFPFPVLFYGTSYTTANVSSNGNLQFTTTNTAYTNVCLPQVTLGPAIMPFWDDLITSTTGTCLVAGGCGIFTNIIGSAPTRAFYITWQTTYFTGTGNAFFAIVFHEGRSDFDVIYNNITATNSFTLGVQDGAALSTEIYCNVQVALPLGYNFQPLTCVTPTSTYTWTPVSTGTPTRTPTSSGTSTPTPCGISFSDVQPTDYFYTSVLYLACRNVISGYGDGTFRPFNNTTRGQMSKIVMLAESLPVVCPTQHFTDVPPTHPFYCYIEAAYGFGIVNGYADGTFRPGNNVTRAQTCKIVVLAEAWTLDCPTPHFTDVPSSNPFFCYVETAYGHGIISGYSDGTFRPGNDVTRGQLSKIVYSAVTQP